MDDLPHTESQKSLLIILQSAPYGNASIKDALDIALTCAAFEQPINILLMLNAAYALLPNQQSEAIEQKSLNKLFAALSMYDIESLHVSSEAEALLKPLEQQIPNQLIYVDSQQIATLIREHDIVQRF